MHAPSSVESLFMTRMANRELKISSLILVPSCMQVFMASASSDPGFWATKSLSILCMLMYVNLKASAIFLHTRDLPDTSLGWQFTRWPSNEDFHGSSRTFVDRVEAL